MPGEQAQADWAHFGKITIGAATHPLVGFVMVLSFSRQLFLRFYDSVPHTHVRRTLVVVASPAEVRALDGANVAATHSQNGRARTATAGASGGSCAQTDKGRASAPTAAGERESRVQAAFSARASRLSGR